MNITVSSLEKENLKSWLIVRDAWRTRILNHGPASHDAVSVLDAILVRGKFGHDKLHTGGLHGGGLGGGVGPGVCLAAR